jgi:hypothetical protein
MFLILTYMSLSNILLTEMKLLTLDIIFPFVSYVVYKRIHKKNTGNSIIAALTFG